MYSKDEIDASCEREGLAIGRAFHSRSGEGRTSRHRISTQNPSVRCKAPKKVTTPRVNWAEAITKLRGKK